MINKHYIVYESPAKRQRLFEGVSIDEILDFTYDLKPSHKRMVSVFSYDVQEEETEIGDEGGKRTQIVLINEKYLGNLTSL